MRTGRAEATASHSSASRRRQWGPNWPWPPHLLTPETRSSSGGGRKCLPGLLASSPAKGLALCPPRGRGPCKRGHKTGEEHLCPGLHCSGKPTPPPGAEESFSQPPTETPRAREGVWSGGGTLRLVPPPHLLHPCVPRPTFCAPPPAPMCPPTMGCRLCLCLQTLCGCLASDPRAASCGPWLLDTVWRTCFRFVSIGL